MRKFRHFCFRVVFNIYYPVISILYRQVKCEFRRNPTVTLCILRILRNPRILPYPVTEPFVQKPTGLHAGRVQWVTEINEMEVTPNSGQCNDGRSTWVKLALGDVEKMSGRN